MQEPGTSYTAFLTAGSFLLGAGAAYCILGRAHEGVVMLLIGAALFATAFYTRSKLP